MWSVIVCSLQAGLYKRFLEEWFITVAALGKKLVLVWVQIVWVDVVGMVLADADCDQVFHYVLRCLMQFAFFYWKKTRHFITVCLSVWSFGSLIDKIFVTGWMMADQWGRRQTILIFCNGSNDLLHQLGVSLWGGPLFIVCGGQKWQKKLFVHLSIYDSIFTCGHELRVVTLRICNRK